MRGSSYKATIAALGMLCFATLNVVLSGRPALAAATCHDVYVVTARGSGEAKSGDSTGVDPINKVLTHTPELQAVYSGLIDAGSSAWVERPDIAVHDLTYPAPDVKILLSKLDKGGLDQRSKRLLDHNLPAYLAQEREGERELSNYLQQIVVSCAGTDKHPAVVLAGYSQGAMVVHNVLRNLVNGGVSSELDLIAGAVLVADPERMPLSKVTNLGTALPLLTSYGLCPALDLTSARRRSCLVNGHTEEVPSRFLPNTVQICDTGDLVCDAGTVLSSALNPIQFTAAVVAGIHTHVNCNAYCATSAHDAGAFLAQQLLIRGVGLKRLSVATVSLPAATVGVPYVAALNAQGGLSPFTWSVAPGSLPANLSLFGDGGISGTPNSAGTYQLPVTVTDKIGHTASGTITLVVTPPVDGLTVYGGTGPAGTVTWVTGITCPTPAPGDTMWVISQGAGQPGLDIFGSASAYPVYHGGAPIISTDFAPVGTFTATVVCAENSNNTSAAGAIMVKTYSVTQTITGPSRPLTVIPANDGQPGFRYTISDGGGCGTSPHGIMGVVIVITDQDRPTISIFTGLPADSAGRWGPVTLPFPASAAVGWTVQVQCRVGVGPDNSGYNYPIVNVQVP